MDKNTKIISAFPCMGKTYVYNNKKQIFGTNNIKILDSDSSKFSWITDDNKQKIRNPDFPSNYIKHIKDNIGKVDYIFVSSHKEVRDQLLLNNIDFYLIIPNKSLLVDIMIRSMDRNDSKDFTDNLINNWDNWLDEIHKDKRIKNKIILNKNEYISDIIMEV